MDIGDSTVGRPRLGAVDDPLIGGFVVLRSGADGSDVRAGAGFGGAECGQLGIARTAEHLRQPFADLLRRTVGGQCGRGKPGGHDGQRDTGVTPEHFFEDRRHAQAGGFGRHLAEQVRGVKPDFGGLLDDRPGSLFSLVPLGRRRADHRVGELVYPVTDLHHFL